MPCSLWITGDFDPEPLLAMADWEAEWWRKGDPNRKGVPYENSGLQVVVSDADFDDFDGQVADAIEFLTRESGAIATALAEPGVTAARLDFGIAQHDRPAYRRHFSAQLVKLAGRAGLGIEVSLYAVSGSGGFS